MIAPQNRGVAKSWRTQADALVHAVQLRASLSEWLVPMLLKKSRLGQDAPPKERQKGTCGLVIAGFDLGTRRNSPGTDFLAHLIKSLTGAERLPTPESASKSMVAKVTVGSRPTKARRTGSRSCLGAPQTIPVPRQPKNNFLGEGPVRSSLKTRCPGSTTTGFPTMG